MSICLQILAPCVLFFSITFGRLRRVCLWVCTGSFLTPAAISVCALVHSYLISEVVTFSSKCQDNDIAEFLPTVYSMITNVSVLSEG